MTAYPHPHGLHLRRPHVNLWQVAVIGLAAALIGLGSWVLVDRYTGGSSAAGNATTLLDKFDAAVTGGNATAATALVTKNFVVSTGFGTITGPNAFARELGPNAMTLNRIAPVSVNGDYATTFMHFSYAAGAFDKPAMLSVAQIKDGKIARLWMFNFGETAPFDKIAK